MTTLTMDEALLVSDYRREDDLEELWLELARDLIDHARITREWLVWEARDCVATTGRSCKVIANGRRIGDGAR